MNHTHVVERYYPDCVDLVQELTGARYVHAFDQTCVLLGAKGAKPESQVGNMSKALPTLCTVTTP